MCRFVESFFKNISKMYPSPYAEKDIVLTRCFLEKVLDIFLFPYLRRNGWRFDGVFYKTFSKNFSFHCYGDLEGVLGRCFLKKVLLFTIRRFRRRFGTPFCKKYKKRAFVKKSTRAISIITYNHYCNKKGRTIGFYPLYDLFFFIYL